MPRYIGFLTRCALSKPHPELSIVNVVNAMSRITGRISEELSAEIFGDKAQADQLAYSGLPTTRPHELRSLPFKAVEVRRKRTAAEKERAQRANGALRNELRQPELRARLATILHRSNAAWDVANASFGAAVCLDGVARDRDYEKPWDCSKDGQLHPTADGSLNRHIFACACNDDTGVEPVAPLDDNEESVPDSSLSSATQLVDSSQRAPFQHHEVIAYGLVKRWLVVTQKVRAGDGGRGGGGGGDAAGDGGTAPMVAIITAIIAHVRIFSWEVEADTRAPLITQRCPRQGYDDHYMLADHIVCRITLFLLPATPPSTMWRTCSELPIEHTVSLQLHSTSTFRPPHPRTFHSRFPRPPLHPQLPRHQRHRCCPRQLGACGRMCSTMGAPEVTSLAPQGRHTTITPMRRS